MKKVVRVMKPSFFVQGDRTFVGAEHIQEGRTSCCLNVLCKPRYQ